MKKISLLVVLILSLAAFSMAARDFPVDHTPVAAYQPETFFDNPFIPPWLRQIGQPWVPPFGGPIYGGYTPAPPANSGGYGCGPLIPPVLCPLVGGNGPLFPPAFPFQPEICDPSVDDCEIDNDPTLIPNPPTTPSSPSGSYPAVPKTPPSAPVPPKNLPAPPYPPHH